MKTLNVRVSDEFEAQLRRIARERNQSISELMRRALAREFEEAEGGFARHAAPYRGMFIGEPDLSSREGYGHKKPD